MRTLLLVVLGAALFVIAALVGRALAGNVGMARAAAAFVPLWLIAASANMYVGVKKAGYTVVDEAPIFLVVFSIPAAAAIALWWRYR